MKRTHGVYEKYVKRIFDIICSLIVMMCFAWLYIIIAILVRIKLGSPVFFEQLRPGKDEKIFRMYKFRSMTNQRGKDGSLLPDEQRLTKFGRLLRRTSLDELPEIFNILSGDMSIIGPRPQLIKDMVFMTDEQRKRHCVMPGLSGLAQINGRNLISWEEKINWDLKYIKRITFWGDLKIIFITIVKAFVKQEGITMKNMDTALDYGDYLLKTGKISRAEYDRGQNKAKDIEEYYKKLKK